jgi:hypothetical protein
MMYFVYKMLSESDTAFPEAGMQAIPAQRALALPDGALRAGRDAAEAVMAGGAGAP